MPLLMTKILMQAASFVSLTYRKSYSKGGTTILLRIYCNTPPMLINDVLGNIKPETCAAFSLTGMEQAKGLFHLLIFHADTVVGDGKDDVWGCTRDR